MIDFFKNSLTFIGEIIVLILAIIWFYNTKEIEPLITIIVSSLALLGSIITYFLPTKKSQNNIIGKSVERILDEDFLYNYLPGRITINKIIEEFGEPDFKYKDSIEQDWNDNKKVKFLVHKYKFSNALILLTTGLKDKQVISISLISSLDKKHPIKCMYSFAEDEKYFGEAKISQNIIDNAVEFEHNSYASWTYSAITSRYIDYRPIKYLNFTYFTYNNYENKDEMKNQIIDGMCISISNNIKPIINFDEYLYN